jgi:NADH-quinone oxidoreductase subunit N
MTSTGVAAILVYLVAYLIMNLGAFFVVMLIANKIGSEDIDDYNGLAYRNASLSVALVVFLVSLTGLPPTVGFVGKLAVFAAVLKDPNYLWLAVVGILNSVVSLYYYLKVVRNMFLRGTDTQKEKLSYSPASIVLAFVFAIPVVILGVYYTPLFNWANASVGIFLGK